MLEGVPPVEADHRVYRFAAPINFEGMLEEMGIDADDIDEILQFLGESRGGLTASGFLTRHLCQNRSSKLERARLPGSRTVACASSTAHWKPKPQRWRSCIGMLAPQLAGQHGSLTTTACDVGFAGRQPICDEEHAPGPFWLKMVTTLTHAARRWPERL